MNDSWMPYPFTQEQWNASGIKLHIGCGTVYLNDFINIDLDNPTADENYNAFKLPYKDNSVSLILASHLIEHFKWQDHIPLLTEWHRVLIPGHWVIIEAPNLDEACKALINEKDDTKRLNEVFPQLFGRPDFSAGNVHLSGVWYSYLFNLYRTTKFIEAIPREPIANSIQPVCLRVDGRK